MALSSVLLVCKPAVEIRRDGNHCIRLEQAGQVLFQASVGTALSAGLMTLSAKGIEETKLERAALAEDGIAGLTALYAFLEFCKRRNLLNYTLYFRRRKLLIIEPLTRGFSLDSAVAGATGRFQVSRFAYIRRERSHLVLESPLASARILLDQSAAQDVTAMMTGAGERISGRRALVRDALARTGFLEELEAKESSARKTWEFHDVLFHQGSRAGRTIGCGGTYRFRGKTRPLPALKPQPSIPPIRLKTPDLSAVMGSDATLIDVLENRRSLRAAGTRSITVHQLAEFLYRLLHIQELRSSGPQETMRRVYPSGGGLHELEFYLAVNRCDGLERGLYYYHAAHHQLYAISARLEQVEGLLDGARQAWGEQFGLPDVLIILAARVPRVAWKYEGMAYRTVLLDAGAAIQTMYLIATAMALAPCALGNGDPKLFAAATGLDPFDETSVAEFALSACDQSL